MIWQFLPGVSQFDQMVGYGDGYGYGNGTGSSTLMASIAPIAHSLASKWFQFYEGNGSGDGKSWKPVCLRVPE